MDDVKEKDISVRSLVTASDTMTVLADITAWATELHLAYAWASSANGTDKHWQTLPLDRVKRAVVGIHFAQTEPYVLRELHARQRLRIVNDTEGVFHPKLLVAVNGTQARVLVGSSNFTSGGFGRNREINLLLEGGIAHPSIATLRNFVEELWNDSEIVLEPNDQWFERYEQQYASRPRPPRPVPSGSRLHNTDPSSVVRVFHGFDFHDVFQDWRRSHQTGFFVNLTSKRRGLIHEALCDHPGNLDWSLDDEVGSLTAKAKACADQVERLFEWAEEEGVELKWCADCTRRRST